jgi:hypothetical protein
LNGGSRSRRAPLSLAVVAFLVVAGVVAAQTLRHANVPGDPHGPRYGLQDFRDAIYYPTVSFLAGGNPYDVARHIASWPVSCKFPLYAPHTLVVHAPFGLVPHVPAQMLDLALNLLMMVPLAWIALRTAGLATPAAAVFALAAALLVTRPGEMTVFLGQGSAYLVAGVFAALHFARTRPWLAGAGLALAATKPTFGLAVGVLMLCRGDVRAVLAGGGLAAAASAVALPVLVHAAGGITPFVASLHDNYARWGDNQFTNVAESVHRVDAYLLFGRLAGHTLGTVEDLALMLAVFALAGMAVARLARRGRERAALSAAVICAATLTGTYHQTYDALVLAVPALALWTLGALPATVVPPWTRALVAALIAVPAFNFLASYGVIRFLGLGRTGWLVVTTANAAAVLACFVVLAVLALRVAAADAAADRDADDVARVRPQPRPARA